MCLFCIYLHFTESGNFWELGLCAKFLVLINFMVKLYLNSLHYYTIHFLKIQVFF